MNTKAFFLVVSLMGTPRAFAANEPSVREPKVPAPLQFVRTLDIDAFVQRLNNRGRGAQTLRVRTRYLDPEVNAFVGLITSLSHFNQNLYLGPQDAPTSTGLLWNWGIDLGIVRGRHLWELDLMGAIAGSDLGPATALVGEHAVTSRLTLYHRAEINYFFEDAAGDLDGGIYWMWKNIGLSAGYRVFLIRHSNRSGPHIGIRLLFESPKIPFLFPSIG